MSYYRNEELFEKFNKAVNDRKLILITAATGFGKTRFIEEALANKSYTYISLKDQNDKIKAKSDILVIDDFQYIVDKEYLLDDILELVKKTQKVIISSRSNLTKYFMQYMVSRGSLEITESDLRLSFESFKKLLGKYLSIDDINAVYSRSLGCPLTIIYFKNKLEQGNPYSLELLNLCHEAYADHVKLAVFDFIDVEVLYFLIQVSVVDTFNIDLARAITMNDKALSLASKAIDYGNFMFESGNEYTIRPEMLYILRKKVILYYSYQEYNEFKYNAGHYYESIGDIKNALKLYEESDNLISIKRILLNNSTVNPAVGDFKILKKYYEMLDGEDIKKYPVLMSGMCMLYALLMDTNKSEYYYNMLKDRLSSAKGAERIEIVDYLDYLDISLPQRGANDLFQILSMQIKRQNQYADAIPFPLTSNCPSIINGGKDFTSYLPRFNEVLAKYGELMTTSMGNSLGKGLLSAILAECLFETGADLITIMPNVVKARIEVDKTSLDTLFVLTRLEVLLSVESGKLNEAYQVLRNMLALAKQSKNNKLVCNINAYIALLYIITDNEIGIVEWIKSSPDENLDFFSTDRVEYLAKAKCYIYLEKYVEAYSLITKLRYYAEKYDRYYILTETYLLQAIINYHTEQNYYDELLKGLKLASNRGLIRVVSSLGVTIDEMITKNRDKLIENGIPNEFILALNPLLLNMSTRYPRLYNKEDNVIPKLSKTGIMILQLQSQGRSLKDIADRLQINLETIRYHAKQNYKKLGAAGSTEAVTTAKKLGIL